MDCRSFSKIESLFMKQIKKKELYFLGNGGNIKLSDYVWSKISPLPQKHGVKNKTKTKSNIVIDSELYAWREWHFLDRQKRIVHIHIYQGGRRNYVEDTKAGEKIVINPQIPVY